MWENNSYWKVIIWVMYRDYRKWMILVGMMDRGFTVLFHMMDNCKSKVGPIIWLNNTPCRHSWALDGGKRLASCPGPIPWCRNPSIHLPIVQEDGRDPDEGLYVVVKRKIMHHKKSKPGSLSSPEPSKCTGWTIMAPLRNNCTFN